MLNRGGVANPDVLVVSSPAGPPLVVKDYRQRSALVRALIAPWLVAHELSVLSRVRGLPGLPAPAGRIDRLALAMEFISGVPLRQRSHQGSLPEAFFDALEGILEGLASRGVAYLDLRSSKNVLLTPSGGPALVDLASAFPRVLPRPLQRWLERSAMAKLRARFAAVDGVSPPVASAAPPTDIDLGRVRFRLRERGLLADPVPVLLLPDVGLSSALFERILESATQCRRRAIGVDLPGFGASRLTGGGLGPQRVAEWLAQLLRALRIPRADLVGYGWGGLVARVLAVRASAQVRSLITLESPLDRLDGAFRKRWDEAHRNPEVLRRRLRRELPAYLSARQRQQLEHDLEIVPARLLSRAYRELPIRRRRGRPTSDDPVLSLGAPPSQPWLAVHALTSSEASPAEPGQTAVRREFWPEPLGGGDRIWVALEQLARGADSPG